MTTFLSSCIGMEKNSTEENNEADVQVQMKISEWEAKNKLIRDENSGLKSEIEDLNQEIERLWMRIKEAEKETINDNVNKRIDEKNVESIGIAYNMAVNYRNDIEDVFDRLDELDHTNGYRYYNTPQLSREQKLGLESSIDDYLGVEEDVELYQSSKFFGEKPQPLNLSRVIGITSVGPDDIIHQRGVDENNTIYLKMYYYTSALWFQIDEERDEIVEFRGPFAGVSVCMITLELIDDEWTVTYMGIG